MNPKSYSPIIITGTTATGKTSLAFQLANHFQIQDIVACDSRQIFKHLDIVTGKDIPPGFEFQPVCKFQDYQIGYYQGVLKTSHQGQVSSLNLKPVRPLAEEEQGELLQKNSSLEDTNPNLNHEVRLWGFDLALPNQNFSVSNYRQIFIEAILPRLSSTFLLVGGTGYFLDGIFSPKPTFSIPPDSQLRAELSALTTLDLQQKLKQLDSDKFSQMNNSDQNNPRRLIRAIEVASANRHPTLTTNNYPQITPIWIGLRFSDINLLDEVIVQRVNARFQNPDLASEIKFILKNNWQTFAPSQTLGYPQLISYFQNQITSDQALTEWITKEKQYARRQLTWFKKQPQIKWFSPGEFDSIKDYLASQLN